MIPTAIRLLQRRQAKDWSQADLARLSGVSRAAISAMEGGKLTPSVSSALAIARALQCTVEELFGEDPPQDGQTDSWAWRPRRSPARFWEARLPRGVLLFPVEALGLNPIPQDGVDTTAVDSPGHPGRADQTLTLACCDPAAGLLATEYARDSGFRLLVFPRSGAKALELLRDGVVHVAGLHRSTTDQPEQNAATVRKVLGNGYRLLRVTDWEEGVAVRPGKASPSTRTLVQGKTRWAAREVGSAARECLEELLGGNRFTGREVDGHNAVSEAVHSGWADAGICVRLSAEEAGLDFIPMRTESLDLCFASTLEADRRIQCLIQLLRTRAYRNVLQSLPGYHPRQTGELASI